MIPAGRKADLSGGERRETPMSKIHSVPGLFGGEDFYDENGNRVGYGNKRLEKHPWGVLEHGIGRNESAGIM